jgi:hypothetical protein
MSNKPLYTLSKKSLPNDWEKHFNSVEEAGIYLRQFICKDCQKELGHGFKNNLHDLLGTSCGCEFEFYDYDGGQ